jgi:hypothetical protein
MNKGVLILISGLIGAGKTTLAKILTTEKQAIRLCPDNCTLSILIDQSNIAGRDRMHDFVEELLWKRVGARNSNPSEPIATKKEVEETVNIFQPPSDERGQVYDYFNTIKQYDRI